MSLELQSTKKYYFSRLQAIARMKEAKKLILDAKSWLKFPIQPNIDVKNIETKIADLSKLIDEKIKEAEKEIKEIDK